MKKLLTVAAVAEAAMGLAFLTVPSLIGQLPFGAELTGIAMRVAQVTGIALIALGVGCWRSTALTRIRRSRRCYEKPPHSRGVRRRADWPDLARVSPIVIRLLFDSEIAGAGVLMSRIAGISLIALGVACWPDRNTLRAFLGILTYSLLAMVYLVYVGFNGGVGILLWPAIAAHAGLSVLFVRAWGKEQRPRQQERER